MEKSANRFIYALLGLIGSISVPFGWLLWRGFSSRRNWWLSWLESEFKHHQNVYLVLTICAVTVFVLVGYFLGKLSDDLLEESQNVRDSNYALSQLATTDSLTGLFNARYIHERLDIELENAYQSPLSCLLVDIDHFKRINDTYGHPFGDRVLVDVAGILKKAVRRIDPVGRLGGEEFIIVLSGITTERAQDVAERIRKSIEKEKFIFEGKNVHVTVSLGVVTYPSPELPNKESLLQAVDDALYAAKKSGRNRVILWEGLTS